MIAQTTVLYGGLLTKKAIAKIPGWTLPFLVSRGQSFMKRSGNSNLRLVESDESVKIETTSETAFEEEYGSSESEGDNNLQSTFFNLEEVA